MGRKKIILSTVAAIFVALIIWIIWGNTALELNNYMIYGEALPENFDGYRIAHISDLHNTEMGDDNEKLLAMLRKAQPDIIAITGDIIDMHDTHIEIALQFICEVVKIAPCYYVPGNHEALVDDYENLKIGLIAAGVTLLEEAKTVISLDGESITLVGARDPVFYDDYQKRDSGDLIWDELSPLREEDDGYTILLSHRPELFDTYVKGRYDLVLSGHAHGGQVRLPFLGGIFAPHQGIFPEYDAGLYTEGNTNMIVSRGIGNSSFPLRFNNRPEVILIELRKG